MLGKTAEMKLTNRLLAMLMFAAISWPVWTYAQAAPDVVANY